MSMEIDYTTPLTEQERAFLMARGRYADVERADNAHGTSGGPEFYTGDGTGPIEQHVVAGEAAADRKRQLLAELAAIEEAEQAAGSSDSDDDIPPYEEWNVKELDKELKSRQLSTDGTKEAKVRRLYEHDEQTSQQ